MKMYFMIYLILVVTQAPGDLLRSDHQKTILTFC